MGKNVVAIYDLPDDRTPLGAPLAQALGKTLYEANTRLRAPGSGPLVVASFDAPEAAAELKAKIEAGGLRAVTVGDAEVRPVSTRLLIRSLSFSEQSMRTETRQGEVVVVPYSDVRLLLHAMSSKSSTTVEKIKEKKLDIGMAVASGGMIFRKTVEREIEHTEESREPFLIMLTPGKPVLEFREAGLIYDFLGPDQQPSRAINFKTFITKLRERCQGATYDNRLLQKPEQMKLLGSLLNPENHLDMALTILAKVLWATGKKQ